MGRRIPLLATSIGCTRIGSTTASTIRRGRRTTLPSRQESDRVVFAINEFTSLTGELNKLSDPIFAATLGKADLELLVLRVSQYFRNPTILLTDNVIENSSYGTFNYWNFYDFFAAPASSAETTLPQ